MESKEMSKELNKKYEIGQYRNAHAQKIAERMSDIDKKHIGLSLRINVNIDSIIPNRDPETLKKINEALEKQIPFCLYTDKEHYIYILPKEKYVACFVGDEMVTKEILHDELQFMNRVRIAVVVYEKFKEPDNSIDWEGTKKLIAEYEG